MIVRRIRLDSRGSAAAEMALVLPFLVALLFGSLEVGNFFYNEHLLRKAVRDGARYAARQSFTDYVDGSDTCALPSGSAIETNVKELVKTGYLSGGTDRMVDWDAATITLDVNCFTSADDIDASTENMLGIYSGRADGAPVVEVNARVPYVWLIGSPFGFSGRGVTLNASDQAAVVGI